MFEELHRLRRAAQLVTSPDDNWVSREYRAALRELARQSPGDLIRFRTESEIEAASITAWWDGPHPQLAPWSPIF